MKAAVIYGKKDVRIEEFNLRTVGEHDVKIKVAWAGICGSDLHAYHHGSAIAYEEHPLSGRKVPLVLGHEFSGTVSEVGAAVTDVKVGDHVAVEPVLYCGECETCKSGQYNLCEQSNVGFLGLVDDGGFAEYAVMDRKHVHILPEGVSLEEGALIEPTAVAFQAVKKSGLQVGQSVAIYGAGPIGLLTLLVAKAAGAAEIFVIDVSGERLNMAKELGATYVINPTEQNASEEILRITGKGVEHAYEVAGVQPTFTSAMESITRGGTVTVVAGFAKNVELDPMVGLSKEANLTFTLAYANVFPAVIKAIAEGKMDVKKVITHRISLDNIVEDGLERLLDDKSQAKILVHP
ncbi:2,3-butanediol dehydrogenase [Shouchella sp. 1P09AA]|uniref:2,3-butanediol dehydrogenase n=1 Tax=unclassified Shouchella TaxID=2893065 RepID=UPI0039A33D01